MPDNSTKKREVSDGDARQLNKKGEVSDGDARQFNQKKWFLMEMPDNSTKKKRGF